MASILGRVQAASFSKARLTVQHQSPIPPHRPEVIGVRPQADETVRPLRQQGEGEPLARAEGIGEAVGRAAGSASRAAIARSRTARSAGSRSPWAALVASPERQICCATGRRSCP